MDLELKELVCHDCLLRRADAYGVVTVDVVLVLALLQLHIFRLCLYFVGELTACTRSSYFSRLVASVAVFSVVARFRVYIEYACACFARAPEHTFYAMP